MADDSHPMVSGSTAETREVEVAGVAILFDRPGQHKNDTLAAFIVILPLHGASRRPTNSDSPSNADIVEAALLCRGLVPITTLDPRRLREIPTPDRWLIINRHAQRRLTILEPTGCLFDGLLGRSVPDGWYSCLARQRALLLLVVIGNESPINSTGLTDLCEAGRLVGGLIAASPTPPASCRLQLK